MRHIPVLLDEVIQILQPKKGEAVLDCTIGLGGHSKAFLERIGKRGLLIGLDRDIENLTASAASLHARCIDAYRKSDTEGAYLMKADFRDIATLHFPLFHIIFADLGLSSPHVDDPGRGFTWRQDAPLDLRFDRTQGETVTELIRRLPEEGIADILRRFGELRQSRKLAQCIKQKEPQTTAGLRAIIEEATGRFAKQCFPLVFQAFRIAVNDELGALQALLDNGPSLLQRGGRMGIISYHSLEDRMVKRCFRDLATPEKDALTGAVARPASFQLLAKKPIRPTEEEILNNPRARSAKFRVVQRFIH